MASSNASRQVVAIMAAVATAIALAVFFGTSFYYDALYLFWPSLFENEAEIVWMWLGWGSLAVVVVVVVPLAGLVGWWLSRRMVAPLIEVAAAVRAVAGGDLSARANPGRTRFGEAVGLIEDFNRMAERLERSQDELRYQNSAIAHELRTPLTILKGRLQGVSDGVFPMSADLVDLLSDQVDGLTRIVDDLSTLSLLNAGRIGIRPIYCDLAEIAANVAALLRNEFDDAHMFVVSEFHAAPVVADPLRLRQAMLALCINATRYAGGTMLEVSTGIDNGEAFFSCRDHGPGMTQEGLERCFEPFWRADGSRTREKGGSGLGLAVVKAVAEAHQGRLTARNGEGGGALFLLQLPLPNG